jgi:hypothetical protein
MNYEMMDIGYEYYQVINRKHKGVRRDYPEDKGTSGNAIYY